MLRASCKHCSRQQFRQQAWPDSKLLSLARWRHDRGVRLRASRLTAGAWRPAIAWPVGLSTTTGMAIFTLMLLVHGQRVVVLAPWCHPRKTRNTKIFEVHSSRGAIPVKPGALNFQFEPPCLAKLFGAGLPCTGLRRATARASCFGSEDFVFFLNVVGVSYPRSWL